MAEEQPVLTTIEFAMLMKPDQEAGADLRPDVPVTIPQPQPTPCPTEEVHRQRLRQRRESGSRRRFSSRDAFWQLADREEEQTIRREAAAYAEQKRIVNVPLTETAKLLDISERTLRYWRHDLLSSKSEPCFLGRPHLRCTVEQAEAVTCFLHSRGPWVGVPVLRAEFPDAPRRAARSAGRLSPPMERAASS